MKACKGARRSQPSPMDAKASRAGSSHGQPWIWSLFCWCLLSGLAFAQSDDESEPQDRVRVELFVTASTDRAVFVDRGSSSGIELGDRATFFPPLRAPIEGIVRAVTAHHARIELLTEVLSLPVGTRGEVWVPRETQPTEPPLDEPPIVQGESEAEAAQPERPLREHPPWQAPPEEWNANTPLLSPALSTSLAERQSVTRGRTWAGARLRSTQLEGHRESGYFRTGLAFTTTNPLGAPGEFRFDGEVYSRYAESPGVSRETDEELRLTHLSYKYGSQRDSSRSFLLGRFYQEAMPEFGPLDGLEFVQRIDSQNQSGVSVGHMPRRTGEVSETQDYQASLFHLHRSTSSSPFDWRVGYQRTWHQGRVDRDLGVLDGSWRSVDHDFLTATAWIDYYEHDEVQKADRLELTRLFVAAGRTTTSGDGLRLSYSEFRFPSLLRQEFDPALDTQIFDEHTTRTGLDGWTRLRSGVRLRARVDRWADEEGDGQEGYSTDLRCDIPEALPGNAELGLALYGSVGEFSDNAGLRIAALGRDAGDYWSLAWELQLFEENSDNTPTPTEWQNQLQASYDTRLFQDYSLSLDASASWGDQGDSLSLGLFLQRSF